MKKDEIPFSGPFASFWTNISSLNLQLMISTQFTDQECLDWESSLRVDLQKVNSKINSDPIVERLKEAPLFMLNELRSSFISTTIINFTSTTEHYLKDMIELSLQRNSGFRKKAFVNHKMSAIELEENIDLNDIKKRIFKIISAEHSKGPVLSSKFKKASSFLSIKEEIITSEVFTSLDSIWRLRNKIAHSNKGFIKFFEIDSPVGLIKVSSEPEKEDYFYFCISLLKIIDDFTALLNEWDRAVLEKWPANSFIS
ncbi:hypothetical protein ACQKCJ_03485 [Flavobacterium sp. NPDC079362]|uniref:hypothetical protein n=1 Tax=Flavobacterium sp. NPDC079362 TaxID=3390566 RepID=UPI003D05ED62